MIVSDPLLSDLGELNPAPDHRASGNDSSHLKHVLISISLTAILAFTFLFIFQILRTAAVLAFRAKKPLIVALYDRFFGYASVKTDLSVPGTLGPIQLRMYAPVGAHNPPPVILVHGFANIGNRDHYLNAVAKRFAEMGFLVYLPTVPAETHYQVRNSDLTVIDDTIRVAAADTHQKVTLMGISFGGGLVIPAAAQPSVVKDVKLIFSISGYNNLDSIARYFIHMPVFDPSGKPYAGDPPGPLVLVSPYLDDLVPPQDAHALGPAIYDENSGEISSETDPYLQHLNPKQKQELAELKKMETPQLRREYLQSIYRHRAEIASMSPSSVLPTLKTPLYVLHGTYDPIFPEGEFEWMRKESVNNPNAHFLASPWISHVFVGNHANLWQKIEATNFCSRMLDQAATRVPLQ